MVGFALQGGGIMASGNIRVTIDRFLTNSRLRVCLATKCENLQREELNCTLKEIALGDQGQCKFFVEVKQEATA